MPIYAYKCSSCGHAEDALQKLSAASLTTCPACQQETYVKQVTAAGFQLKGSGWYVTDFRNNGASAGSSAGAAASAASGTSATSDAKNSDTVKGGETSGASAASSSNTTSTNTATTSAAPATASSAPKPSTST